MVHFRTAMKNRMVTIENWGAFCIACPSPKKLGARAPVSAAMHDMINLKGTRISIDEKGGHRNK